MLFHTVSIICVLIFLAVTRAAKLTLLGEEDDRRHNEYLMWFSSREAFTHFQDADQRAELGFTSKISFIDNGARGMVAFGTLTEHELNLAENVDGVRQLRHNLDVAPANVDFRPGVHSGAEEVYSWGLDRVNQRNLPLDSLYTWHADGEGVGIIVVDSGVDKTHPDWNEGQVHFVADCSSEICQDDYDPLDLAGHGSHVAGTAASPSFGVAKKAQVFSVCIFPGDPNVVRIPPPGTTTAAMLAGLQKAGEVARTRPNMRFVVNFSASTSADDLFDSFVEDLWDQGIVFVASAGNTGRDACLKSPPRILQGSGKVISVAASNVTDGSADFTSFGECADLYAPGVDVTSLNAGHFPSWQIRYVAAVASGTSMSAPHVAGAAALILSAHPHLSPDEVKSIILDSATPGVVTDVPPETPNLMLYTDDIRLPTWYAGFAPPKPEAQTGFCSAVKETFGARGCGERNDPRADEGYVFELHSDWQGEHPLQYKGHTFEYPIPTANVTIHADTNLCLLALYGENYMEDEYPQHPTNWSFFWWNYNWVERNNWTAWSTECLNNGIFPPGTNWDEDVFNESRCVNESEGHRGVFYLDCAFDEPFIGDDVYTGPDVDWTDPQVVTCGDTINASNVDAFSFAGYPSGDRWFKLELSHADDFHLSTCNEHLSFDSVIRVYEYSEDFHEENSTLLYFNDDFASPACGLRGSRASGSVEGSVLEYLVSVEGYEQAEGDFRLDVTCGNEPIVDPSPTPSPTPLPSSDCADLTLFRGHQNGPEGGALTESTALEGCCDDCLAAWNCHTFTFAKFADHGPACYLFSSPLDTVSEDTECSFCVSGISTAPTRSPSPTAAPTILSPAPTLHPTPYPTDRPSAEPTPHPTPSPSDDRSSATNSSSRPSNSLPALLLFALFIFSCASIPS